MLDLIVSFPVRCLSFLLLRFDTPYPLKSCSFFIFSDTLLKFSGIVFLKHASLANFQILP